MQGRDIMAVVCRSGWYVIQLTVVHGMCSDPKSAKDVHYPILTLVPYNFQVQISSINHTQRKNKTEER